MKACEVSSRMAEMRASSYGVLGGKKKMAWKEEKCIDDYIRLSINDTISKRQIVESIGTKHASKYNKLN